jgi:CAAX prenyl protease-like protein
MTIQQQPQRSTATERDVGETAVEMRFFSRASSARILPFAVYMAFIAIADGLSELGVGNEGLRWLYPVKVIAVLLVLLAYRRAYTELSVQPLRTGELFTAVAVGLGVLVLWVNLDVAWMQIGSSAGFDPRGASGRIDWGLVLFRIAGAALIVPLMEELFWRSFLLRWIADRNFLNVRPARAGLQALVVTVVLFGFEHNLWLAGMVAGLAYSLLYMRTGNLWSPILAHAVTNGLLGLWILHTSNWSFW